eukprot:gene4533-4785_t
MAAFKGLLLHGSEPDLEIRMAKTAAASAIMFLATIETGQQSCDSGTGKQHPSTAMHNSSAGIIGQDQRVDINPHPPFQGVFRSCMVSAGLLSGLLQLAKELNHCKLADRVVQEGMQGHAADISRARTTCEQVVAAAVQWLVAVNEPLPPVICTAVLDYLSQQLDAADDTKQEIGAAAVIDELSSPVKLGLRLLVECLGALPDWVPALPFKALVVNCCWSLSHADKVMSEELVDVGLLHHVTAICQQLRSSRCFSGTNSMLHSVEGGGVAQVQAAVAGYLMAAVHHSGLVGALGGPLQVAQLLLTMLLSCITDR